MPWTKLTEIFKEELEGMNNKDEVLDAFKRASDRFWKSDDS